MSTPTMTKAPRQRGSPKRMLAVLLAAPFMAQADATIANVATPSIHDDLHASGAALELVIGGYLIAFAMLLITGARLGQTHGYRRMFLLGIAVFSAASLGCGLAPDPTMLVVARVLQGAGAALMFPQTMTGIQLSFTGGERVRAIGLFATALSTGAVVGQILGGVLISANIVGSGWRAIFLVNVPVGVFVLAVGARWLPPDDRRLGRHVDLAGLATLSAAVLLLVVPLALGRTERWRAWTWACLAVALPVFAVFVAVERRVAGTDGSPLINVAVIARPTVSWGLVTFVATTGSYYALLFTLAQYLQTGLGDRPLISGLIVVPWVAAFGLAGRLVRRVPARLVAVIPAGGCLVLAAAYLAISATLFAGQHPGTLLIMLLAVGGFGLGLQFAAMTGHLMTAVPADYAADISGVTSTTTQIGGALGVAAIGTLYLSLATQPGAVHATHAFACITAALGAVAMAGTLTAYLATRQPRLVRTWDIWT